VTAAGGRAHRADAALGARDREFRGQGGFALLAVAAILAVVGAALVLGAALHAMRAERARSLTVADRIDSIADAVLAFAQTARRLPCPAGPGADGVEQARDPAGHCLIGTGGPVPWRTLALPPDAARDGRGGTLVYRVSGPPGDEATPLTSDAALLALDTSPPAGESGFAFAVGTAAETGNGDVRRAVALAEALRAIGLAESPAAKP